MRADAIAKYPDAPKMLIAALQDVAQFLKSDTAEADKNCQRDTQASAWRPGGRTGKQPPANGD